MRLIYVLLTLCLLAAPSIVCADEAQSAKEGFKETHEGMKKVTKAVGHKAKKDFKAIDKKAKKDWKAIDKKAKEDLKSMDMTAKKFWAKAGADVKKAFQN